MFSLFTIPIANRESALQLKIKQWSPFQDYASYIVWHKGQAQVWIWDQTHVHTQLSASGIKKALVMPETVLQAPPTEDTVRLVTCLEGVEGQIWRQGRLVGSRWWPQVPPQIEWAHFQRTHGVTPLSPLPEPLVQPLLERPWGRPKAAVSQLFYQEFFWVTAGVAIFTVLLTWHMISLWQWQHAITSVQQRIEALQEKVAPILAARTQAINDKRFSEQVLKLVRYPTQLELIAQVAEQLPQHKETHLVTWAYQTGRLDLSVQTKQLDPISYVKTFQAVELFKDVRAEISTKANRMEVHLGLVATED